MILIDNDWHFRHESKKQIKSAKKTEESKEDWNIIYDSQKNSTQNIGSIAKFYFWHLILLSLMDSHHGYNCLPKKDYYNGKTTKQRANETSSRL